MAPSARPAAHTDLPERLLSGLEKVGQVLRSQTRTRVSALALTPTQAQILSALAIGPAQEIRLSHVADSLGVSAPTASDAVATLIGKKLVAKGRSRGDRRAVSLRLTPSGRRAASRAAGWAPELVTAAASLGPQRQGQVVVGVVHLLQALADAGLIPVARMCLNCENFRARVHPDSARPHHCVLLGAAIGERDVRFDCASHVPRTLQGDTCELSPGSSGARRRR